MERYNHKEIDKKWQEKWEEEKVYKTESDSTKSKYYVLDMFPYPSGAGLHVGHPKGYIATDILAKMKMMQGFNVLHPMGWDAFGLPAENYAIKNKVHPAEMTERNIATFKRQLKNIGLGYDWSREINTTDPDFYKWSQWTFIQMYKKGLAFQSNEPIIWCPGCQTGLAQEDLEDGRCERCDSEVERKPMRQWVLRITDYADRMIDDLDLLPEWEDSVKEMQKNWIGRSEGAEVDFVINGTEEKMTVFTTRPDTLFGCTYTVLSPEHKILEKIKDKITNWSEVEEYIKEASHKSDLERTDLNKDKSGVKLEGVMAINPINGEEVPIFMADYVLAGYGTGAIMAVPAHDERDHEFAKKYNIEIKEVVAGGDDVQEKPYCEKGEAVNSDFLNGLETEEAKSKTMNWLAENKKGERKVNYRLNDWVFSRQRYWGEPIPMIHCKKCGTVPVPEDQLPVKLPMVDNYEPSGTGESPLATIDEWVNTTCPKCGADAKRETNTMPQWAGSSWYYLRYIDPKNNEKLVDEKLEKYFSPVDFYVGGAEHVTRHLIYARFWHKFLYDIGVTKSLEPFKRLQNVGLIMAEDGRKMSKRWGNVVNPDDIIEEWGADALRVYEMFMGPFAQAASWNTKGLGGSRKFLERIWGMQDSFVDTDKKEVISTLHKTIKKVTDDIADFKFNTAISQMMIFVNKVSDAKGITRESFEKFVKILAPFAPQLAEELWRSELENKESIFKAEWPKYDEELIKDEMINLVIQVNGKVRATIEVEADITEEMAKQIAHENEKVQGWLEGKEIVKEIFVKGKLLNIVVK